MVKERIRDKQIKNVINYDISEDILSPLTQRKPPKMYIFVKSYLIAHPNSFYSPMLSFTFLGLVVSRDIVIQRYSQSEREWHLKNIYSLLYIILFIN